MVSPPSIQQIALVDRRSVEQTNRAKLGLRGPTGRGPLVIRPQDRATDQAISKLRCPVVLWKDEPMSLNRYCKERNFKVTPEPSGAVDNSQKGTLPVFVIQKHRALDLAARL